MKHCPQCSLDFPDTAIFCKYCGSGLVDTESTPVPNAQRCPSCGTEVKSDWKACVHCNHKLSWSPVATTAPTALLRICSGCGIDNPADALFCRECGKALDPIQAARQINNEQPAPPQPTPTIQFTPQPSSSSSTQTAACRNCGVWNRPGLRFCEVCGKPLGEVASQPTRRKSRKFILIPVGSVALLGIIFLVWFLWGVNLTITSSPSGARVFIDNEEAGQTSLTDGQIHVAHLGRGQHTVRVERQGFAVWSQTFDLGAFDFSKTIEVKLDPNIFTLTIITDPTGCRVLLDALDKGITNESDGEIVFTDVSRGQHTLTLQHDGYEDWTQNFSLDSTHTVRASLTPVQVSAPEPAESAPSDQSTSSNQSTAQQEVISTMNNWAQSLRDKNLDRNVSFYADHVGTFLSMHDATPAQIRASRAKLFAKYDTLSVQLSNLYVNVDASGTSAVVTLDNTYNFRGRKYLDGSSQNEFRLEKRGGSWLITNERHIQTYHETSGG